MKNPTRDLVLSKVKQAFPEEDPATVLALLDLYGLEPHETERERTQLAILKLSEGSPDKLLEWIETAKRDNRDAIGWAEYPNFMEIGFVGVDELDAQGIRELKEKDLHQYLSWLQNTDNPDMSDYKDWLESIER